MPAGAAALVVDAPRLMALSADGPDLQNGAASVCSPELTKWDEALTVYHTVSFTN